MTGDRVKPDRRVLIADAAIEVLATDGSRGLTHRAVDRRLELPAGSTSYYFRTRDALVAVAASRLVALDEADIAAITPDAAGLAALIDRWLRPKNRSRLIARFELFLASSRSPEPGPLATTRVRFAAQVEAMLASAGADDPRIGSVALTSTIEGLLLDGLMGGRRTGGERAAVIEQALATALRSSTAAPSSARR